MSATTPPPPRLSDAELEEMLALTRDADSVELKLTVPEAAHRSTVTGLGMDPLDAEIRQVYFFDTPDLSLDAQGVVVRARRIQRRDDDTVVKLRPVVPDQLPKDVRRSRNLVVEVDAMPGRYVCSAALKHRVGGTLVHDVAVGRKPIRRLYSKQQRRFFAANTAGVELDDLSVLGPITILKLKFRPEDFGRRMVAELWQYPDGSQILELSTKCAPTEAFQVAAEARAYLVAHGVDLSGDQQTKTRMALEYFSTKLDEDATV